MQRWLVLGPTVLMLAGCAITPDPLKGEFSPLSPSEARSGSGQGAVVRWGGEIVSVRPLESETCVELLFGPLSSSGRPSGSTRDEGRFIACKAGFLDPATFKDGREVTVVGRVEGVETHRIGEYDYRFPVLDADVVYLWPERREYDRRHYYHSPFFYDPFFWPYPYRYSTWYHPYRPWPKASGQGSGAGDS